MIHERMRNDLCALGIKEDDTILMHSSLSSLGYVEGGAETVIDTLLSVLARGTLLVPTLSYVTVTSESPVFSVLETESCVGAISEYFRKRDGVLRSMHPTHSVAGIGVNAAAILSQHGETDTPVGARSPFALLPQYRGKVLMLGCGLRPNTSMHGVEELSLPPYLLAEGRQEYRLIDESGNETVKAYRIHDFNGVIQRYDRLQERMEIRRGNVLSATAYLIDARTMWEVGHAALLENEMFFVDTVRE